MDGDELLSRTVDTVQEMCLKIGRPSGSVSLYYPVAGDASGIAEGFRRSASGRFPGTVVEVLPQRLRVIVPEEDCIRMSQLPVRRTMADVVALVDGGKGIDAIKEHIASKYPGSSIRESGCIDFDWILLFPEELDSDVYCLSEEMGRVTYHRFSRDEFLDLGFSLPRRTVGPRSSASNIRGPAVRNRCRKHTR